MILLSFIKTTLLYDFANFRQSMDIKYVHVHGIERNVLLLTVIDIYSRKV